MRDRKQQAARWLSQAEYDLKKARELLATKDYAYACFFAEQSAQKAIKAFLFFRGRRFVPEHSVKVLIGQAADFERDAFAPLIQGGAKIDRHYLASRYPDAVPDPAVPYDLYTEDEAEEAVAIAKSIFEASRGFVD